jgi:hypothetical protein
VRDRARAAYTSVSLSWRGPQFSRDLVLIGEDGAELLTDFPYDPDFPYDL